MQLDHFCSHWLIKLPMKFFAPIMRYKATNVQKYTNVLYYLDSRQFLKTKVWSIPRIHLDSSVDMTSCHKLLTKSDFWRERGKGTKGCVTTMTK